jgi:hypothetical protein
MVIQLGPWIHLMQMIVAVTATQITWVMTVKSRNLAQCHVVTVAVSQATWQTGIVRAIVTMDTMARTVKTRFRVATRAAATANRLANLQTTIVFASAMKAIKVCTVRRRNRAGMPANMECVLALKQPPAVAPAMQVGLALTATHRFHAQPAAATTTELPLAQSQLMIVHAAVIVVGEESRAKNKSHAPAMFVTTTELQLATSQRTTASAAASSDTVAQRAQRRFHARCA